MATAGEGSYEVGGGGKVRKRLFRRPQTTPYDRPPSALRKHRNGWLSKVVDPASRLITARDHRFFDSGFRKRLPPPPPPPLLEVNQEPRDKLQEAVFTNSAEAQEQVISDGSNPRNSSDGSSFTLVEQILKQKTFTSYEIDRLTALLHSITVDLPVEDEEKRSEGKFSKPPDSCDRQGEISNNLVQENETESHRFLEAVPTPIRVLEEDVAPPKELNAAPPEFSFDSETVNKLPLVLVVSEPSGLKFGGFADPKLKISSSGLSSSSTAITQSLGPTPFGAGSGSLVSAWTSSAPAGTGIASSTQSMLIQFGSSASSPSFVMAGAAPLNSGNSLFGSSTPAKLFGMSNSGLSSSVSLSEASTSISSTSGITYNVFSSNWQSTKSPVYGSTVNSTSPSTGFIFGCSPASVAGSNRAPMVFGSSTSASTKSPVYGSTLNSMSPSTGFILGRSPASVAGSNRAPMVFGSSTSASSASAFSFNPAAGTISLSSFPSSQPVFGNSNSIFAFGSATGNHDQMNKDSMAEDTAQASTPALPVPLPSPAFMFNPFQFGSQKNSVMPQNPSHFQASSCLDLNSSGSFTLGTVGGASRRMVKVKHNRRKK